MDILYIHDPFLPQSLSIAKMIKEYDKRKKTYGVMTNDKCLCNHRDYNGIIFKKDTNYLTSNTILVPTGATATKMFLEQGDIQIGNIFLSKETLIVYNKVSFLDLADKIGIPVPKLWKHIEDVPNFEYPIFYKQKEEKGGGIRGLAKKKKDIPVNDISELIFQEYINSKGTYGVGFIAHKGDILCSFTHFERESIPREGGSAVFIEKYENQKLLDYTKLLLKSICYSGWGLAEYKYCKKRDDFVLMEINAKFWASCEFAFRNNPAFFKLLFNIDTKKENIKKMVYLDRVLERGILFFILNLKYILSSRKKCQVISLKHFVILVTPKSIFKIIKRLLQYKR